MRRIPASLRDIGCHALQGYGISPPLPLERLLTWLGDGARPAMGAVASPADTPR